MFIQDVEGPKRLSIIRSMMNEVIAPDMVTVLWSQPDARIVIQPEPPFPGLLHWHFEPLASPKTFDTLAPSRQIALQSPVGLRCHQPARVS